MRVQPLQIKTGGCKKISFLEISAVSDKINQSVNELVKLREEGIRLGCPGAKLLKSSLENPANIEISNRLLSSDFCTCPTDRCDASEPDLPEITTINNNEESTENNVFPGENYSIKI